MGENINQNGVLTLYTLDGKKVAVGESHMEITTVKDEEPWSHKFSFSASGTLTVAGSKENTEAVRRLLAQLAIQPRERKRMMHCVTHGGAVRLPSRITLDHGDGRTEQLERYVYICRPSQLRRFIAWRHGARFQYDLVQPFDPTDKIILKEFGGVVTE